MGYSCTTAADNTLSGIMALSGSTSSNAWEHDGFKWFYSIGRENADGAITGSVYKINTHNKYFKAGSFRIEADGSVSRFPGLTKKMRQYANSRKSDF